MSQQPEITKIILVNGSPFLHELLRSIINKNQQIQIVAEVENISRYPSVAARVDADWTYLVLPPDAEIPEAVEQVLKENPSMRVLVMATDGSKVRVKWMEPHDYDIKVEDMEDIFNILKNKGLVFGDDDESSRAAS